MLEEINKIHELINKIEKQNNKIINDKKIIKLKELIEVCQKYPRALIITQQPSAIHKENFLAEYLLYPDFHISLCSPIKHIKANEQVIALSYNHQPVLEEFSHNILLNYKDYLTGYKLIKMFEKEIENKYFFDLDYYLFNNFVEPYYFERNNWKSVYNCESVNYTPVFAGYKTNTRKSIFLMDSHY